MGLPDNDRGRPRQEAPSNVVLTDTHMVLPTVACAAVSPASPAVTTARRQQVNTARALASGWTSCAPQGRSASTSPATHTAASGGWPHDVANHV